MTDGPRARNTTKSTFTAVAPMSAGQVAVSQAGPLSLTEIEEFGREEISKASSVASKLTQTSRVADIDELGKGLTNLMAAAREYDPSKWNKGILGMFMKMGQKQLDTKVRSIDQNVDTLINQCRTQIGLFRSRNADLEEMAIENQQTYDALGDVVEAATMRVEWAKQNTPAVDAADPQSAQRKHDWEQAIIFAEKRIDDLRRVQVLCQLQGPQISQTRDNGALLIQKFNNTIDLTLPLLRQQYGLYILQMEQKKGAALATAIDDETEAAMKRNAELLRANTVNINTAMARSIVSVDTLKHVHEQLLGGLQDVDKIRTDMVTRLKTEAPQIAQQSRELIAFQSGKKN